METKSGEVDAKEWESRARNAQKGYCNAYAGAQFHAIPKQENHLLQAKPTVIALMRPNGGKILVCDGSKRGYRIISEQKKEADKIVKILLDIGGEFDGNIHMLVIFVVGKIDDKEFALPVFTVKDKCEKRKFVDTSQRIYNSWSDWECQNNLPMMEYCYPKFGYYSCASTDHHANMDPALTFGRSPACNRAARAGRFVDTVGSIAALTAGAISIVGIFTPLAPAIIGATAMAGSSSALYGTVRSAYRLYDKNTHGQSLADLESGAAWLAIFLTPVNFATSIVNSNLADGARTSGRIFSNTTRGTATLLNYANIGLQGGMLLIGVANLIEKGRDNITSLDVLQLSMSVFFFGNTLVQPKTASQIISKAQDQHFLEYKNQLTDAATKQSFEKFLSSNQADGGIAAKSKIVRTLNRISNPDQVFKGIRNFDKVEIGGRKGKTLLLSKDALQPIRINPNRVFFETRPTSNSATAFSFLGANYDKFEVNGRRIFEGAPGYEVAGLCKAIKECGNKNGRAIYYAAKEMSSEFNVRSPGDLQSIVQILNAELNGPSTIPFPVRLYNLMNSRDFVNGVNDDVRKAAVVADSNNVCFTSPLKAAYHYRKHGAEFPTKIPHTLEFYLQMLPDRVLKNANLSNIVNNGDVITKTYSAPNGDFMVVTVRSTGEHIISTLFKNLEYAEEYARKVADLIENPPNIVGETWSDTFKRIQENLGTNQLFYSVHTDGQQFSACDADAHGPLSYDACKAFAIALLAIEKVTNEADGA